jgi:uncharacterized protein (DUF488 family)
VSLERILTIGYEGASVDDFLATLKLAGVTTLLDIREIAISRRPGFAKTALREGLTSVGIQYRHESSLGSPKVMRHRLRDDKDYELFFREFSRYLKGQDTLLRSLVEELDGSVALLCFERDHTQCHRSIVANCLSMITGSAPQHLGVQGHAQRQTVARSRAHTGEGLPTA